VCAQHAGTLKHTHFGPGQTNKTDYDVQLAKYIGIVRRIVLFIFKILYKLAEFFCGQKTAILFFRA
jgi:hypothetical protein